jgi:UDP-N-acetylmuramyl tripeptide synthase
VLEASSHALEQGRVAGCAFRVAALTNVTLDHLDYHGTQEAYFDAKSILFHELLEPGAGTAVLFADREDGRRMLSQVRGRALTVATTPGASANVRVLERALDGRGTRATLATPSGNLEISSPLVGDYNLENMTLATGMALAQGVPLEAIARGIAALPGVPGRLERVPNQAGVLCLVDYSHKPDALERALAAMRPLTARRLILVFGCGGDRDRSKRPIMGEVAARGADVVLVTSDNPRTEDPGSIIDMIVPGVRKGGGVERTLAELAAGSTGFHVDADRRSAIRAAVAAAREGDTLVIAGKGHEDYQILGAVKITSTTARKRRRPSPGGGAREAAPGLRHHGHARAGHRRRWGQLRRRRQRQPRGQARAPVLRPAGRAHRRLRARRGGRPRGRGRGGGAGGAGGAGRLRVHPGDRGGGHPRGAGRPGPGGAGRVQGKVVGVTGSNGKTTTKGADRGGAGPGGGGAAHAGELQHRRGHAADHPGRHRRRGLLGAGDGHARARRDRLPGRHRPAARRPRHQRGRRAPGPAGLAGRGGQAKGEIFGGLGPDGVAVLPNDEPRLEPEARASPRSASAASASPRRRPHRSRRAHPRGGAAGTAGSVVRLAVGDEPVVVRLPLAGEHNARNAAAALAVAAALGAGAGGGRRRWSRRPCRPTARASCRWAGARCSTTAYNANPPRCRRRWPR